MSIEVFDAGDEPYQHWMRLNEHGVVANTGRSQDSRKFTVHWARCFHIAKYGAGQTEDCFTKGDFVKICSVDASDLEAWASLNRTRVTQIRQCRSCRR